MTSTRMSFGVFSAEFSAGGDFTSSSLNLNLRYTPRKVSVYNVSKVLTENVLDVQTLDKPQRQSRLEAFSL